MIPSYNQHDLIRENIRLLQSLLLDSTCALGNFDWFKLNGFLWKWFLYTWCINPSWLDSVHIDLVLAQFNSNRSDQMIQTCFCAAISSVFWKGYFCLNTGNKNDLSLNFTWNHLAGNKLRYVKTAYESWVYYFFKIILCDVQKEIYSEIKKVKELTNPIKTNRGYLIIKINL